MKQCTKCKDSKELVLYSKRKASLDGYSPICKICKSNKAKTHYKENRERIIKRVSSRTELNRESINDYKRRLHKSTKHKPVVYLLINEDYVGVTENIKHRLSSHKHRSNRDTSYRILAELDNREDALELEALLHSIGYNGKHKNNLYI
tara:strand:- start:452 stop:895 length:444 start_codon:yes stop_codon:yes gene_type:complete